MRVISDWNVRGCSDCPFLDRNDPSLDTAHGERGKCKLEFKRNRFDLPPIVEAHGGRVGLYTPEWCPLKTSPVTVTMVARRSNRLRKSEE